MRQLGSTFVLLALSSVFAYSQGSSVSSGVAAAAKAMSDMRLTADEPSPAPVAEPPAPEAVPTPDPVEVTHLTYDVEPGLSLYRNMKALDDLAVRSCNGAGCFGLFGIQEYYSSNFSAGYKATIPLLYSADKMLGDAAHDLASHICTHTYTGVEDDNAYTTVFRMLYTQNEAMTYLKVIQSNAGRSGKDIANCVPSDLPVNGVSLAPKPPKPAKPTKPAKNPK